MRSAALRGWAFLYTSLGHPLPASTVEVLLPVLAALLHDTDVEVRGAAGEAIALVYHTSGFFNEDLDADDDDDAGSSGGGGDGGDAMSVVSGGTDATVSCLEDVVDRMRELATNKGGDKMRRNKRDKAAMKGIFRELSSVMEVSG